MNSIVVLITGYIAGVVASWLIFRPMKAFEDGYYTAKEHYSNWEKGFNQGWDAAFEYMGGDRND